MRGDPARDAHADRGDLVVADPDAALSLGALSGDAVFANGPDQHLFEFRHVLAHVAIAFAEVDDRIADELAGTVIGDVTPARGLEETDALGIELGRGRDEVADVAAAAEGDDGRVLEQQKLIGDHLLLPQLHELLLQPHAVLVRDEMKVAELTHAHQRANTRGRGG